MKSISTLVFGEILWDIIENQKYIGGAPLNFAAHIVKCGGSSSVISGVGNDELGRLALEYVHKLDVDASAVFFCNRASPIILSMKMWPLILFRRMSFRKSPIQ